MTERTPSAPITNSASTLAPLAKARTTPVASLLDANEAMVQMDQAVIQPARQGIQQVGAVKRIVRRAVTSCTFPPVIEFEKLTGLHVPRVDAWGRIGHGGDLFAQPDGNKRPCCVRGNIYGCADFAQGGRRFKDFCLNPEAGQAHARRPIPRAHPRQSPCLPSSASLHRAVRKDLPDRTNAPNREDKPLIANLQTGVARGRWFRRVNLRGRTVHCLVNVVLILVFPRLRWTTDVSVGEVGLQRFFT